MKDSKYRYSSDENYYFVSVNRVGDAPRWIRNIFQTKQEVQEWIEACAELPHIYQNLQIYPESVLEQNVVLENDTAETRSITLRQALFGSVYAADNEYYTLIKRGECDFYWKDGYDEWMKGQSTTSTVVNS